MENTNTEEFTNTENNNIIDNGEETSLLIKHLYRNKTDALEIVKRTIINAIQTLKVSPATAHCTNKIYLGQIKNFSDELANKFFGTNSSYYSEFKRTTGIKIELNKTSTEVLIISKHSVIEIQKSIMLIERFFTNPTWDHSQMEEEYQEGVKKFKEKCISKGSKILKHFLKYQEYSDYLAELVGLLRYSYSFSQNILDHSLEVAQLSANIAAQIGLNSLKAKRAGFFHDIGKAIANHDDHVLIGLEISKKENLDQYIQNTIECHHGRVSPNNKYAFIVKAMDKVSAGRLGARPMQIELIAKRKDNLSKEIIAIDWIDKVNLKNAGNLIEIYMKPSRFDLSKISEMKKEITEKLIKLNANYTYNYQLLLKVFYKENFYTGPKEERDGMEDLSNAHIGKMCKAIKTLDWVSHVLMKKGKCQIRIYIKLDKFDFLSIPTMREEVKQKIFDCDPNNFFKVEIRFSHDDAFTMKEYKLSNSDSVDIKAQKNELLNKTMNSIEWIQDFYLKDDKNQIKIYIKPEKFEFSKFEEMKKEVESELLSLNDPNLLRKEVEIEILYRENFILLTKEEVKLDEKQEEIQSEPANEEINNNLIQTIDSD